MRLIWKRVLGLFLCAVLCVGLLPPVDVLAAADVEINQENFPDVNFMLYVREELDTNQSGALSTTERNQVTEIDVSNMGIKSLEGVGYFTNIEKLECYGNQLTWLNVQKNWALTYLDCSHNLLEGINGAAEYMDCSYNCLTDIPVDYDVKTLICRNNLISSGTLVHCADLEYLDCSENQLTALDLSDAAALRTLDCSRNRISSLNVSNNTELHSLRCHENGMLQLGINHVSGLINAYTAGERTEEDGGWLYQSGDDLLQIDKNTDVHTTDLEGVPINEDNFPDEKFRSTVSGYDNDQDGVLNDGEIAAVTYLRYPNQGYTSLKGVEHFTWLEELNCSDNKLTELDVSKNLGLRILECGTNKLKTLDVSHNACLMKLSCGKNSLQSIDVSMLSGLQELDVQNNQLTAVDVSGNPQLTVLECGNNELTALDISGNPKLTYLSCKVNRKITALDVTGLRYLEKLYCGYNALTELDVSKNPALVTLDCEYNQLTALDVSQNAALGDLIFDHNQLTSIDTANNPALSSLTFRWNQIAHVDIQKNTELKVLHCDHNGMTELDIGHNPYLIKVYTQGSKSDLDGADDYVYNDAEHGYLWLIVDPDTVVSAVEPCQTHTPGSWTTVDYTPATCAQEGGYDEVQRCSVCGEELNREHHVLEKLPHTEGEAARENEIPATCIQEGGYDEVVRCTVCGEELNRTHFTLDKVPHTPGEPVNENIVDAACTESGHYDEVIRCSVCGEELNRTHKEIPALGHVAGEPLHEDEIPATCTEPGSYDLVVRCSRCGTELLRNHYDVSALGHEPGEPTREHEIPATHEQEGSYEEVIRCTRCHEELSRTTVTIPVISDPPVIITQPRSRSAVVGATVTFTVEATGENLTYQWYCLPNDDNNYIILEGETSPTLTVKIKAGMNKNTYWCSVENDAGYAFSDNVTLTVLTKPRITTQPKAATVKAGKKVTFKVKATGGALKYQWYYQKKGSTKWVKISKATKASYSFTAKKTQNGYKYRCMVRNTVGKVYSKAVKLTVK